MDAVPTSIRATTPLYCLTYLANFHQGNGNYTVNTHSKYLPHLILSAVTIIALFFKLHVFGAGAPYVTIDDNTLFEAGFLVWFGEAPPQRMYLESWIAGLSSILTYIVQMLASGNADQLGLNIVADAYRAFLENPNDYVTTYRSLMLSVDLATSWLVFLLAKCIFVENPRVNWLAVMSASMFLLSYNTLWCYIVARPDTVTTFFATLGILYYYKSNFGESKREFYIAALALGCATGLKLHAALFIAFFIIDMIRQLGLLTAIKRAIPFGLIAIFIFSIVAGSPLFDPLLYAKLRALNIRDDESPWLQWGDQIITLLRGTGWILVPIIITTALLVLQKKGKGVSRSVISILFIATLFLLFFISIRQLRAYWMLPALPLFYIVVSYALAQIKNRALLITVASSVFIILLLQIFHQSREFENAHYDELQHWVQANVKPDEVIYIVGYDTLFLPCNTNCLENRKFSIEYMLEDALDKGEPYTQRHIRLWEERARLKLIDMLNVKSVSGFNYYGIDTTPLDTLADRLTFSDIQYALVMQDYSTPESKDILLKINQEFTKITTVNAPGGKAGTGGLPYDVYVRNAK